MPYDIPGSDDLASKVAEALEDSNCAIIQNHGVVTVGKTLREAYDRYITLEYIARALNILRYWVPRSLSESILHPNIITKKLKGKFQVTFA